ncbi:hypothetical protein [Thermogemmatispora onikobensis]|uniref:hypothetical protein n=1 Tax=Thermogemmatispora onikobensis TaxID=732234 RepID=UPI00114CC355|nr:hypothetical protein [Thermogemmatispora onikobensis]
MPGKQHSSRPQVSTGGPEPELPPPHTWTSRAEGSSEISAERPTEGGGSQEQAETGTLVQTPAAEPAPFRLRSAGLSRGQWWLYGSLAALLLLTSTALLVMLTTGQATAILQAQATARAQATRQVLASASAQAAGTAQALATQQAAIYATATAQSLATAQNSQLTATATAYDERLSQITQGQPAFSDDLSSLDESHGWDQGFSDAGTGCFFNNGAYEARAGHPGLLQPCLAHNTNFSQFVYEVQLTITHGQEAGLLFRASSDGQSYYLFRVSINGSFALDLYQGQRGQTLLTGFSPAISSGLTQTNILGVLVSQESIVLYVNEQAVGSVQDHTLSTGAIGVVAIDDQLPCVAQFSNAQVWALH